MHLATTRAGLPQYGFALRADQPARDNPTGTTRARAGQRHLGRSRLVELHADTVKNHRQAYNKKQKHVSSYRLRQFVAGIAEIIVDLAIAQIYGAIKPLQVLTVMGHH